MAHEVEPTEPTEPKEDVVAMATKLSNKWRAWEHLTRDVRPLNDQVLLRQIPPPDTETPSGLFIPAHLATDQSKTVHRADVIAVGSGRLLKPVSVGDGIMFMATMERRAPMSVKVGDVVLVGPYTGTNIPIAEDPDGVYIIIHETDILAVDDTPIAWRRSIEMEVEIGKKLENGLRDQIVGDAIELQDDGA